MSLSIAHVELHVADLPRAKQFYIEVLGLELLDEVPQIGLVALRAGGVRLSIFGSLTEADRMARGPGTMHFVYRSDDIARTAAELRARGIPLEGGDEHGIHEAPGFIRYVVLHDPEGNRIEIGQYLRDPLAARQ
jgi:predicted enzyme related to lactoylglutathione lyase